MTDAKAVAFLEELLQKTREDKIHWQPTAIDGTYISAFGGKFGLAISHCGHLSPNSLPGCSLKVDDGGREVIRIEPAPGAVAGHLERLYETARKQALAPVDDTKLDSVLAELQRL